jgi:DNA-binding beta-propeller fold protein YncE
MTRWTMLRLLAIVLASLLPATGPAAAKPAGAQYVMTRAVPLGPPEHWDFLSFDLETRRVFIAHGTELTVVDGADGRLVGRLPKVDGAHGVVLAPKTGLGYVDSEDRKSLIVFDKIHLRPIRELPVAADPDAVVFDLASDRVFVMGGTSHAMTAIDARRNTVIATVPLGGQPEFAVADGAGALFVNLTDIAAIARIDTSSLAITARWRIPTCNRPHGLAYDPNTRRLFASCANKRLLVVSAITGRVIATLRIGARSDAVAFDPVRRLVFSANGDGTLSIIRERGRNRFIALRSVSTRPGARTMALDPRHGRLFLVTGDVVGKTGNGGAAPRAVFAPGSVKLLFFDPTRP